MRPAADAPPSHESPAGAFGIPEFMPPNRRRTFKVIILYYIPVIPFLYCTAGTVPLLAFSPEIHQLPNDSPQYFPSLPF